MNSRFSLTIKDPELNKQYILSRNKEILIISSSLLLCRLVIIFTFIIDFKLND